MKNIKLQSTLNIFSLLLCIVLIGCKKFLNVEPPINKIENTQIYDDDNVANAAIMGLYSTNLITLNYHNINLAQYTGMAADELKPIPNTPTSLLEAEQFNINQITNNNSASAALWANPYKCIYLSNLLLEGLENSKFLSNKVKNDGITAAKFFRALNYLDLITTFGDVPLILKSDLLSNINVPRTPSAEVYMQVIKDLTEAKAELAGTTNINVFVTEKAVTALLARVYLYNKEWQKAVDASTELISGNLKGTLALETLSNVFLRNSKETIFAISSNNPGGNIINYTVMGNIFAVDPKNSRSGPSELIEDFMNSFETGDARKTAWIGSAINLAKKTYYFPYKYKLVVTPADAAKAEDQVLFRLAELYLIRAEANAQLDNLSAAIDDINVIRVRAGLKALDKSLDKSATLLAIEKERKLELFTEYSHRWIDLIRTGRADAVLKPLKGANWQSTDVLFPINIKEKEANPTLTQNPGYTF